MPTIKEKPLTKTIMKRELKRLNCRQIADKYDYHHTYVRYLKVKWEL